MTAPSLTSAESIPDLGPTTPNGPILIPPLEAGDRLSREEFERRYQAMPSLKKAELIEGEVYMPSPVRLKTHALPHGQLVSLIAVYHAWTPGTYCGDNVTVKLDLDNEFQPDAMLMIEKERGGQASLDPDDYVDGAPELVAEIAASTVSIDLGKKLNVYRRNSVREYLVWRVRDRAFDWFVLRDSRFERLDAGASGILKSEMFPGLWIDAGALLENDPRRAHEILMEGLKGREHEEFVKRLAPPA